MMYSADRDKAQLLFVHALAAAQRQWQKRDAHQRLSNQIGKLSDLKLDRSLQSHVDRLDKRVGAVMNAERSILSVQQSEQRLNKAMGERLVSIERKISEFKSVHEKRERVLRQLHKERAVELKKAQVRIEQKEKTKQAKKEQLVKVMREGPSENNLTIEKQGQLRKLNLLLSSLERLQKNMAQRADVPKQKLMDVGARIKLMSARIKTIEKSL